MPDYQEGLMRGQAEITPAEKARDELVRILEQVLRGWNKAGVVVDIRIDGAAARRVVYRPAMAAEFRITNLP